MIMYKLFTGEHMMLQYLIECLNYNQIRLGLEFFKNIKNLDSKYFSLKINSKN